MVSLSDYVTGQTIMVSLNKIISFKLIGSNDSLVKYFNQKGRIVTRRFTQTVADIHTASLSNDVYQTQMITLLNAEELYINNDRVIYVDAMTASTMITYDGGTTAPETIECSLPTAANFNAATDNTFNITTQPTSSLASQTRYINNHRIAAVTTEAVRNAAVLQLKMKPESYTVGAAGTGYTSTPSIVVAGTGGSGSTATATMKGISAVVSAPGADYVAGTSVITVAGGTSTTASKFNVTETQVVTLATSAAGTGYSVGDVLTMVGGTFAPAATLTVSHTAVQSATIAAAGAGDLGAGAGVIVEGTTGTGTLFRASVTIGAANEIASIQSISLAGDYTVDITDIVNEPVTYISGASSGTTLTGAELTVVLGVLTADVTTGGTYTVNAASFTSTGTGTGAEFGTVAYGVRTLTVNTAGVYTVLPANPAAQASATGGGTAATLTISWGVNTVVLGAAGSGYTAMPTATVTGGGGTGATVTAVMEGDTIAITSGGSNYNTAPTITFTGGGGTLLAATTTITLATGVVATATVGTAGGGYTSFPTLVLAGGTGATILYDSKKSAFEKIQVAEAAVTVQSAVNAL